MRRALVVLAALAVAAGAGAATQPLDTSRPLAFPRDHFPHAGVGIEWWYYTGIVRGGGTRYAYFFTLFESGRGFLALSNVVDLGSGHRVQHTEQPAFAT